MAVRISTSKFLSSTVAQAEAKKDLDKPLPQSGGPLPAGIKGGVARLIGIWFETDEDGQESFRAEGEVEIPVVFDGQYIKGKKTKQWHSFNAENLADRIPRIRDIIKYLGGREIFGDGKSVDFIKLVEFLDKSAKGKPLYFGFSTSPKDNSEWPWENWYPAIKGFVPPSASNAPETQPQKKTEPSVNGHMTVVPGSVQFHGDSNFKGTTGGSISPEPWSARNSQGSGYKSVPVGGTGHDNADQPLDTYSDRDDVDSLIQRAMTKDETAMDKLDEFAKALGYDQNDIDEAPDYAVIGGWVKSGAVKGGAVDKPKRTVELNQVYQYEPAGKREGQRLKARECRVTAVSGDSVTLQNLVNKSEVYVTTVDDEYLK